MISISKDLHSGATYVSGAFANAQTRSDITELALAALRFQEVVRVETQKALTRINQFEYTAVVSANIRMMSPVVVALANLKESVNPCGGTDDTSRLTDDADKFRDAWEDFAEPLGSSKRLLAETRHNIESLTGFANFFDRMRVSLLRDVSISGEVDVNVLPIDAGRLQAIYEFIDRLMLAALKVRWYDGGFEFNPTRMKIAIVWNGDSLTIRSDNNKFGRFKNDVQIYDLLSHLNGQAVNFSLLERMRGGKMQYILPLKEKDSLGGFDADRLPLGGGLGSLDRGSGDESSHRSGGVSRTMLRDRIGARLYAGGARDGVTEPSAVIEGGEVYLGVDPAPVEVFGSEFALAW